VGPVEEAKGEKEKGRNLRPLPAADDFVLASERKGLKVK